MGVQSTSRSRVCGIRWRRWFQGCVQRGALAGEVAQGIIEMNSFCPARDCLLNAGHTSDLRAGASSVSTMTDCYEVSAKLSRRQISEHLLRSELFDEGHSAAAMRTTPAAGRRSFRLAGVLNEVKALREVACKPAAVHRGAGSRGSRRSESAQSRAAECEAGIAAGTLRR